MDVETVLHIFFPDCMYAKFFWIDVECLFTMLSGSKINIRKRDVIFYFVLFLFCFPFFHKM